MFLGAGLRPRLKVVITVEFRGVAFELPEDEAMTVSDALGLPAVSDARRMTISEAQGQAVWRRIFGQSRPQGWSAGSHRLANALRDSFDHEFDAGSRAFHRRSE
jgi:hypothetical protein